MHAERRRAAAAARDAVAERDQALLDVLIGAPRYCPPPSRVSGGDDAPPRPDVDRAREALDRFSAPPTAEDRASEDELEEGAYHVGRIREAHERLDGPDSGLAHAHAAGEAGGGRFAAMTRLFLAGRYVEPDGAEALPVISPVTGEHLGDLPVATPAQVDEAVAAARTAWDDYRHWSVYERADLCHRIAELIEANADELARLTTLEQGKPLEAEARDDVSDTAELFAVSAEDAKRLYGEVIPSAERGKRVFTFRAPVGVWAGITPWNFPLDDHGRVPRAGARDGQRDGVQAAAEHAARLPARSASCSPKPGCRRGWSRSCPATARSASGSSRIPGSTRSASSARRRPPSGSCARPG